MKRIRKTGISKDEYEALFDTSSYPEDFFEEPKGPFAKLIGLHKKKQKKSKGDIDNILNSGNSR